MSCVENLAAFVCHAAYEDIPETAREQLKIRVLDSLGCAVGAFEGEPVQIVRQHIREFDPEGKCTLIGGGSAAPDSLHFITARSFVISTSTTHILRRARPVILVIIWRRFLLEPNTRTGPAGI